MGASFPHALGSLFPGDTLPATGTVFHAVRAGRKAVTVYQDELRAGIAWIAFWREGRSWSSDYIYLEMDDTLTPEDRSRLQEIRHTDPAAVVLNGYYCGYLGEDMNLAELTAGVRRHYENGYNNIADFIEAHDNALSPEQIEEAREAAHTAGLPFSEKPYRDGDFDPYVFDGSMSAEDYELMHRKMKEEGGIGDGIASLSVPLLDRQGTLVMVHLRDHDGLLPLEALGLHMDAHRGAVAVEAGGGGHLAELIVPLHHVADGDSAVRLGFLGTDDLAVTQDDKDGPRQRLIALVHLLELHTNLRAVLKNERDVMHSVPHEGLLHFGDIRAQNIALGWGDLLREVRPGGQIGKVQVLLEDVAAVAGGVLTEEAAAFIQLSQTIFPPCPSSMSTASAIFF